MMTVLRNGELFLYGFVGDSFWDQGFTALAVVDALAELGHDAAVTVRINSGGGYTDDGIAIYNALKAHAGTVSVIVDSIAASSASLIAMAGDTITMRSAAQMMIHDPERCTCGNAGEHERSVEQLNKLGDLMAGIYAEKSGEDASAIRAEMKAGEIWLNGDEAVQRGYATETSAVHSITASAFDYRAYDRAPERLVALARTKNWQAPKASAPPKPKEKAMTDPVPPVPVPAATPPTAAVAPAAPETPAPAAQAVTVAQVEPAAQAMPVDERARVKAILSAPEAKGRETMAQHLAFETDHPSEAAIALLKTAPEGSSEADPATSPKAYRNSRSTAASLAQPAAGGDEPQKPRINTTGIYAARRAGKETK